MIDKRIIAQVYVFVRFSLDGVYSYKDYGVIYNRGLAIRLSGECLYRAKRFS